jgi:hypothetical protein
MSMRLGDRTRPKHEQSGSRPKVGRISNRRSSPSRCTPTFSRTRAEISTLGTTEPWSMPARQRRRMVRVRSIDS